MEASIIKRHFLQCLFKDDNKVIYLILLSVKTEKNSFSPVTFRLEFILNLLNFYTDFPIPLITSIVEVVSYIHTLFIPEANYIYK